LVGLRYQQHSDGMLSPGRTAVGTETVPTYRPGAIRTVPRGRVLVIHRNLPPILARAVDVTKRPDCGYERDTAERGRQRRDLGEAGSVPRQHRWSTAGAKTVDQEI
jgi:hypothetical protein